VIQKINMTRAFNNLPHSKHCPRPD
jgi:hypothetical protein